LPFADIFKDYPSTTKHFYRASSVHRFTSLRFHRATVARTLTQQYVLQLNVDKCHICVNHLAFIGHHVDQHGKSPLKDKVQSVLSFPAPKTLSQL
uniref:C2H2-type domain-containing protein n=1 Tax=Schistocephalus solidus TaxID=70667 RepID=A0A183TTG5_SCHSO